ncbi:MAG: iron-siderophore ABC transporter permease [Hyphomicrobiales bacterium]|nr:MAG: iron-siderophore ABC transporter permease [Hyphomicrobiales bacterium]
MSVSASQTIASEYHRQTRRKIGRVGLFALACLFGTLLDVLTGPAFLSPQAVLSTLIYGRESDPMMAAIVFNVRLPMTVMALVVGASLGVAGVEMQTILGNPLASPYTLGFSAAAGFGAALAILVGIQLPLLAALTVPTVAFAFATFACLIVYALARARGVTSEIMILSGIATLFLFQSAQSLVQYLAAPEVLQQIVFWLFGSLLKATWTSVTISGLIFLFAVGALIPDFWRLTALRLGDERVRSLGINVDRLRLRVFVLVSLLTAGAVAFVGTIGFVGLVAPHLARMAVGEDQRFLVPASGLAGAFVMVAASVASKMISPGAIIPIGIVTAVVGVPFMFALILKSRRSFW